MPVLFTAQEMIQAAGLNLRYRVYRTDGREYTGELVRLGREGLTLLTDSGEELDLRWEDVSGADQFRPDPAGVPDGEFQAWRKQQQRDLNAGEGFGLLPLCQPVLRALDAYECPQPLKGVLSIRERAQRKRFFFHDRGEMARCLEQLEDLLRLYRPPEGQSIALRAFIRLLGKDYAGALGELLPHMLNREVRYFLPAIGLYSDMGDGAATFFWAMELFGLLLGDPEGQGLGRLLAQAGPGAVDVPGGPVWTQCLEQSAYWWAYLRLAVAFDYYEKVLEHIELLYAFAPNLAIRSLAYLFSLKNDGYKSELLYRESRSFGQKLSLERLRTFYPSLSYHITMKDWGSFFYRYYLRMNEILKEGLFRSYEDGVEMAGYVYEYVNQRDCYCRVLGLDLISYFLHFDNDPVTNEIRRQCRREMGTLQPVRQEQPIRVCFRSSREILSTHKSYQISSAILG